MGGVRAEDRRDLVLGFASLFAAMASHGLVETARDALFLSGLPAERLPWAYLAIAVLTAGVVRLEQRLLQRVRDKRRVLAGTLLVAGAAHAGLAVELGDHAGDPRWLFGLYVWAGLVATIVVVQLWLLLDDVVTVGQAKRIFGPVAAGGVTGALSGAFLAERLLASGLGAHQLLFAAGALLAGSAALPFFWKKGRLHPDKDRRQVLTDVRPNLRTLCGHVYLRRLLMLVLFSTVALTGADYLFKSVVAATIPEAELGAFFARFYVALNAAALLVQLFLSGWLLRAFGVNRALLVLPTLLLAGSAGFAALPALLPVLILKGADGAFRHSLHRTAMEVLYLPLPRELRDAFKGLIDGVGQRGGQALASLAILGALWLGASSEGVVWMVLVVGALWLAVLVGLRHSYLALFRQSLRGGHLGGSGQLMELDLHSLEALLGALNSDQDEEVLVALELFERYDKVDLIPQLVLYHPSPEVVERALGIFTAEGDPGFVPIARRLLREGPPHVRAAALRALMKVAPEEAPLEELVTSPCPATHATALVGLLAQGRDDAELRDLFEACLSEGDAETRAEVARAIGLQGDAALRPALLRLVRAEEVEVRAEAARALAALPVDEEVLAAVLPLLGDGLARSEARETFAAADEHLAADFLARALDDDTLSRRVRRHLPRTLSRIAPDPAAEVLQRRLDAERDGAVRYKILRALRELRRDHPELALDEARLMRHCRATLERIVALLDLRVSVEDARAEDPEVRAGTGGELLAHALAEKEDNALERVFRFLDLLEPDEDFVVLWRSLRSADRGVVAASRELIEHALSGEVREAVLALVDDLPPAARAERAAAALGLGRELFAGTYPQRLALALHDPSDAIRSLVAYHVAELGLADLEPELARVEDERPGFVREVIERAREALREAATPEAAGVA